jgi:hypothetical protein
VPAIIEAPAMAHLTDTQLILLSKASQHSHGAVAPPDNLRGAAVTTVAARLFEKGLMREVPAAIGMPIWRGAEGGDPIALVITAAGLAAIGVEDSIAGNIASEHNDAPSCPAGTDNPAEAGHLDGGNPQPSADPNASGPSQDQAGTKQAQIVRMLFCPDGATITELVTSTGWLAHTVRAALTGLRKKGYVVDRSSAPDGISRYQIKTARFEQETPAETTPLKASSNVGVSA